MSRTFTGAGLARIAFPLGGLGTGPVSRGGCGNLRDWEIFNKPAKGAHLDRTFVALRLAPEGDVGKCRVLEREHLPPFDEALRFQNQRFAGLPRFREAVLASHRCEITVLFRDMRGFTPFAETAEPEEVMAVLREFHHAVGPRSARWFFSGQPPASSPL